MTEIAFLVKPDSEMYRKYFKQKNELDKFVGFASSFIVWRTAHEGKVGEWVMRVQEELAHE